MCSVFILQFVFTPREPPSGRLLRKISDITFDTYKYIASFKKIFIQSPYDFRTDFDFVYIYSFMC